ncbi:hypothetical protein HK102_002391 [Quaeritorhiza haematococci]|nr:hypothetical protein HK102_002391 [Quaeritorhiza haematococci]
MKYTTAFAILAGLASSVDARPLSHSRFSRRQDGGNLGSCNAAAAQLRVGLGVDAEGERAQEIRFVPGGFQQDPIFGGQSSALNPAIVANFICDRLGDQCQAAAGTVTACRTAQQQVVGAGLKGGRNKSQVEAAALGKLADDFNQAIGIQTNFENELGAGAGAGAGNNNNKGNDNKGNGNNNKGNKGNKGNGNNNKGNGNNNKGNGNNNKGNKGNGNNNKGNKGNGNDNKGNKGANAGANLGNCNAAAAQLRVGLGVDAEGERAQEIRFVPGGFQQDPIFGGQSSALNPAIVANFICDRLGDQCQAAANTVSACRTAQQQVVGAGLKGGRNKSQVEAAALGKLADDFNQAIGIQTNFENELGGGAQAGAGAGNGQQQQGNDQQQQQQGNGQQQQGMDQQQQGNGQQQQGMDQQQQGNGQQQQGMDQQQQGNNQQQNNNQGNNNGMQQQQNNNNNNAGNANAGANAGANLGSCNAAAAQLRVGLGVDAEGERAQEIRFVPGGFQQDPIFGGQSSALNPAIVANFICDRLGDQCQAAANTVSACRTAQQQVVGAGLKGGRNKSQAEAAALGKLADDFNQAIGIQTNFENELGAGAGAGNGQQQQGNEQQQQQQGDGQQQQGMEQQQQGNNQQQNNNQGNGNMQQQQQNNNNNAGNANGGANAGSNLGSCNAAAAQLRVGLGVDAEGERAQEIRFVPGGFQQDPIFGGQSSALNPAIVANFICDRLGDQCQAAAGTVAACRTAQQQVVGAGLKGGRNKSQVEAAALGKLADDFNQAIGIQTNFQAQLGA